MPGLAQLTSRQALWNASDTYRSSRPPAIMPERENKLYIATIQTAMQEKVKGAQGADDGDIVDIVS